VTKADIVNIIASRTGLTKQETETVVDGFIETVIESLKSGERIEIRGFGTFNVRKKIGALLTTLALAKKSSSKKSMCRPSKFHASSRLQ